MKLVMTLLVRDEEDILEANLRYHHAAGVDFFIITDNNSSDSTPQIIERWVERGLAHVIHESQDDYAQSEWVTRMARLAATEYEADWVINADADEFFWPRRGSLKESLARVPSKVGQVAVARVNFLPTERSEQSAVEGTPFWRSMLVRDVVSLSPVGVPLPPKVMHRAYEEIVVEQGNHAVRNVPWVQELAVESPLLIFHFPQRSYTQFENKIRLGGAAYERNTELDKSVGVTWRQLYELYKADKLPERYAQDVIAEEAITQGIQSGKQILDRRLCIRLDELMADVAPRHLDADAWEDVLRHNPTSFFNWDVDDAADAKKLADLPEHARSEAEKALADKAQRHQRLRQGHSDQAQTLGLIADYQEIIEEPLLLTRWAQAFTASDPVALVVHAPGLSEEELAAKLVPAVEEAGLLAEESAAIVVATTPGGARDMTDEFAFSGYYSWRMPTDPAHRALDETFLLGCTVAPMKSDALRNAVLGPEDVTPAAAPETDEQARLMELLEQTSVPGLLEELAPIQLRESITARRAPMDEERGRIVDRAMQVQGHLTRKECETLVDLASAMRDAADADNVRRTIVEVGSYQGRSTVALALAAGDNVSVYAIDPHEPFVGEHGGKFGPQDRVAFFKYMLEYGVVERVRLLNLGSVDIAQGFPHKVDFLWLDGDHSDAAVEADFKAWEPHLAPGAIIAFHDVVDARIGPGRVVREAVESGRYEQVGRADKIVVLQLKT